MIMKTRITVFLRIVHSIYFRFFLSALSLGLLASCSLVTSDLEEKVNIQLADQAERYTKLEPDVQRILALESDMQILVEELSKLSNLDTDPLGQKEQALVSTQGIDGSNGKTIVENQQPADNVNSPCHSTSSLTPGHCYKKIGIHIAAFDNASYVGPGWLFLKNSLPERLKNKKPLSTEIVRDNKTYYSLRLGPFASVNRAKQTCVALKKQNSYCAVTEYKGQLVR
ncbi:MAG: hypothetical protein ACJAS1_004542 [Oleiphilaceae bacterium]|jgi:hypothetical protein